MARSNSDIFSASSKSSRELFELAEKMSLMLRAIEAGAFQTLPQAALLYLPSGAIAPLMNEIIDLWQSATGERVKDRMIGNALPVAPAQPLRIPAPQPPGPRLVAGNGASNGARS